LLYLLATAVIDYLHSAGSDAQAGRCDPVASYVFGRAGLAEACWSRAWVVEVMNLPQLHEARDSR